MSEIREKILADISLERDRQITKWTGTFDDAQWNCADWHEMIADYNAWARRMGAMGSEDKRRKRLIQVAALAVAAVEVIDARKKQSIGLPECDLAHCQHSGDKTPCLFTELRFLTIPTSTRQIVDSFCARPDGPLYEKGETPQRLPKCSISCSLFGELTNTPVGSLCKAGCIPRWEKDRRCTKPGGPVIKETT